MKLSLSRGVKIWTRRRKAGHAGALRKSGDEEHQPLEPSQDIWSGDKVSGGCGEAHICIFPLSGCQGGGEDV